MLNRPMACLAALVSILSLSGIVAHSAELPTLHLRRATTPPVLCSKLQNPQYASGWYPSSPTWFGLGGLTGNRNHTEVLATYDSTALYIAFLNIDRSTVTCKPGVVTSLNTVDSNAIWIQTPAGRKFYFMGALDNRYPAQPVRASGEFPSYDPKVNKLTGWTTKGWFAGNLTMQQTIIIPWSTMGTSAPALNSKWRVNFLNYNQIPGNTASVTPVKWAPGGAGDPGQWGHLAFDEARITRPTGISPEAVLTLRPASGFGEETTLRAGNAANRTNERKDEAITQSNWNDWDPVDYTIKEYIQFDLSMIPPDRQILSAVFRNHMRGNFESSPTNLYLHAVRLAGEYDPRTVTMLTSPLPVENGFRHLVRPSDGGKWFDFDVTDIVTKAWKNGQRRVSMALAGSSGDTHNGKVWDVSFGRADWYNGGRPQLVITFGSPTRAFSVPVKVGSLNYTSVATATSKNKLTNGTFRYGQVEGISNTTYWMDPGFAYVNGQNLPFMVLAGDRNSVTGNPALRYYCHQSWKSMKQRATGLVAGKTYTVSGWYKGSASGIKADVRLTFRDSAGNSLGGYQAQYSGSGSWAKVKLTKPAPAGTVAADVSIYNYNSGPGVYMLYSDFQLEEGTSATAYSETMGVYYPLYPRQN